MIVGLIIVPRWGHLKNTYALYSFNFLAAGFVAWMVMTGERHMKRFMVDSSNPYKLKDCFYFGNSLRFEVFFVMFGDIKRLFRGVGIEVTVP